MKRMVFLVMVIVTLMYLVVGAVVFHVLEGTNENSARKHFAFDHMDFLKRHQCLSPSDLHAYVQRVLETHGEGVQVSSITDKDMSANMSDIERDIDEDSVTNWDITSSILFCITVVSTIGYGNMSPKTWYGQLFCILFALIGIPMFATVLVGVGERLQILIKKLHTGRPWVRNDATKDERVKSTVLLTTGMCVILFIPSLVFSVTQSWSYMESVYYSVITLTTIGFGDLVPGYFDKAEKGSAKKHNAYRVVLALWILLGLSWVALIISELSTVLQSKISTAANSTQHRLSNLEEIVKKKAKETKDKITKKEKDGEAAKDLQTAPERESCMNDKGKMNHQGNNPTNNVGQ